MEVRFWKQQIKKNTKMTELAASFEPLLVDTFTKSDPKAKSWKPRAHVLTPLSVLYYGDSSPLGHQKGFFSLASIKKASKMGADEVTPPGKGPWFGIRFDMVCIFSFSFLPRTRSTAARVTFSTPMRLL